MNKREPHRLLWKTGVALAIAGLSLFMIFPLLLIAGPLPILPGGEISGYLLATAGCGIFAWGALLLASSSSPSTASLALPTALGFALLAAMRFIAAFFSQALYEWVGYVTFAEALAFSAVAVVFARQWSATRGDR